MINFIALFGKKKENSIYFVDFITLTAFRKIKKIKVKKISPQ